MKRMLISKGNNRELHSSDLSIINAHALENAQQYVDIELSRAIEAGKGYQQNVDAQKLSGYSSIGSNLIKELDNSLTNTEMYSNYVYSQNECKSLKEKITFIDNSTSLTISQLTYKLQKYQDESRVLQENILSLAEKNTELSKELYKYKGADDSSHHNVIELRMQCLNYKSMIDSQLDIMNGVIKARIGFVPREVEEAIDKIKQVEV